MSDQAPSLSAAVTGGLRLHLGCGPHPIDGYINVDKFGTPDVLWDLEVTPWPWEDNSVDEVVMEHVLEHLGQSPAVFFAIIRELYRVCRSEATIRIVTPHPRHDSFLNDPTHVRPVTPEMLGLFSKRLNRQWAAGNYANSTLALYLDVDFEITRLTIHLDEPWHSKLANREISADQVTQEIQRFNNVAREFHIEWKVIKKET